MAESKVAIVDKPDLPAGGVRFTAPLLKGWIFVRYPIATPAPEGTIGFITDGETWQRAGLFKDGEWRGVKGQKLKAAPKYWTVIEGKADA